MNPYRLINKREQKVLTTQIQILLNQWSEQYAIYPLSATLLSPSEANKLTPLSMIQNEDLTHLAGVESSINQLMTYCLFGDEDLCFTNVNDSLIPPFLSLLLGQNCVIRNQQNDTAPWIYPGSPCLILHLKCQQYHCNIWLSPLWVQQVLPIKTQHKNLLYSLEEALIDKPLKLTLELDVLSIPLNQLIHLQPGDVLLCEHQLSEPMQLKHQQQSIAKAQLGHIDSVKSIIIKECS